MSDDEFAIDLSTPSAAWDKVKQFAQSTAGQAILTTLLILIPVILAFTIRIQPLTFDNLDRVAEQNVNQQLLRQYTQQIQQQNPDIGQANIRQQAQRRVQQFIQNNPSQYEQRTTRIKDQLASNYQKPDGEPYLIAIDPYYHWRHAQNVMDHGYGADTKENGTKRNTYMYAPLGRSEGNTGLHALLGGWIGNLVTSFTNMSAYLAFFILPAIIASLAPIPAFFLGRRHGGLFGGFIAATITASHQLFVSRSVAGFSDTDPYNITLPLFIFWFTVEALTATTDKQRIAWGGLAAITTGVFARAWQGWWMTYIFAVITCAAVIGHHILRDTILAYTDDEQTVSTTTVLDRDWSTPLTALGVIIGGAIMAGFGRSFSNVLSIVRQVFEYASLNQATKANLWPNVFTTVAELGNSSFSNIVGSLGSQVLVYAAFLSTTLFFFPEELETTKQKKTYYTWLGVSALIFSAPFLFTMNVAWSIVFFALPILSGYAITMFEENEQISMAFPVFLTSWILTTLFASVRGTRFTMILMPAYAIALGTGVGWLTNKLVTYAKDAESNDARYTVSILAVIVAVIGLSIPYSVQATGWQAGQRMPSMNDAWYNSLQTIENSTPEDAIITSWWDFGHWFKQVADRRVTFDGASQNTPAAHWVGRILQTSDEDEVVAIQRMLNCGNYKGYDDLLRHTYDTPTSNATATQYVQTKQHMDKALTYDDRSAAEQYYESLGLTSKEATNVAGLTHCDAPESRFITSNDMVGKASVWGHFGLWDFGKAYAAQTYDSTNPQQTINRYAREINISEEKAREYFLRIPELNSQRQRNQWIASYPSYATQGMQSCSTDNQTISCEVNLNLGQNQRGQQLRLEQITAPVDNKQNASLIVGIYGRQSNFRQGQRQLTPAQVSVGENGEITTYNTSGQTGLGVFLHEAQQGQWQALIASPQLTTSMFTRLYFLDGAYTDNFELVSDKQSRVAGNRIKVWKVNLPNS